MSISTAEQIRDVKAKIAARQERRDAIKKEFNEFDSVYRERLKEVTRNSEEEIQLSVEYTVRRTLLNREYKELAKEMLQLYRSIPPIQLACHWNRGEVTYYSSHEDPSDPDFDSRHRPGGN